MTEPSLAKEIAFELKDSVKELVTETVYLHQQQKDKEISGLHRDIKINMESLNKKFDGVKETVDKHDLVIQEILEIYKTGSWIKKFILWIIIFVPSVAGFLTASNYIYKLILEHLNK